MAVLSVASSSLGDVAIDIGGGGHDGADASEEVWFDLESTCEDMEDGALSIVLFDTTYHLDLEVRQACDEGRAVGTVLGDLSSSVLLNVNASGVLGFVSTTDYVHAIEPLHLTEDGADPGDTLVRRVDQVSGGGEEADSGDVEPQHVVREYTMLAFYDKELSNEYASPWTPSVDTFIQDVLDETNAFYSVAMGETSQYTAPEFVMKDGYARSCVFWDECGSSDADVLLEAWSQRVYATYCDNDSCSFDVAHLFTGKSDLGASGGEVVKGASTLPGPYGLTLASDHDDPRIDYRGSDPFQSGRVAAHETGHNFNAVHSASDSETRDLTPDCTPPTPIYEDEYQGSGCVWADTNEKPDLKVWEYLCGFYVFEPVGSGGFGYCPNYLLGTTTHHSIMTSGTQHIPDEWSFWERWFTDTNINNIQNCLDWTTMDPEGDIQCS